MKGQDDRPSYEQLREENRQLRRTVARQQEMIDRLLGRVGELEEKLQEARTEAARQAAPFRRPEHHRVQRPKRPGRKKGHPGCWRTEPERIDQERRVPLPCCPHCGGAVEGVREIEQFIEDIPPMRTHVTHLVTEAGWCPHCGPVRSGDPEQVSEAVGCAKVHLGARALALAAFLKHRIGLSYAKACRVLRLFGLGVSRGGLAQALGRVAARLRPGYEALAGGIRAAPAVYADETSWYVGRPGWWLWVFATPQATLYRVEATRGSAVVDEVLGEAFGGVLVSDCMASYGPIPCTKHKCYAHHQKALAASIETVGAAHAAPLREVRVILQAAMALNGVRASMDRRHYARRRGALQRSLDRVLDRVYPAGGVEKALGRFRRHRHELFTFLDHADVAATNNLAERQLRPAVIARKLSCGNRTERGKATWEVLASLGATCAQQRRSFVDFVTQAMLLNRPTPRLQAA